MKSSYPKSGVVWLKSTRITSRLNISVYCLHQSLIALLYRKQTYLDSEMYPQCLQLHPYLSHLSHTFCGQYLLYLHDLVAWYITCQFSEINEWLSLHYPTKKQCEESNWTSMQHVVFCMNVPHHCIKWYYVHYFWLMAFFLLDPDHLLFFIFANQLVASNSTGSSI